MLDGAIAPGCANVAICDGCGIYRKGGSVELIDGALTSIRAGSLWEARGVWEGCSPNRGERAISIAK